MNISTIVRRGRRRARFAFLVSIAFALPSIAQADSFYNVTVTGVGVQGGQMYISSNRLPSTCGGIAYLQLANPPTMPTRSPR